MHDIVGREIEILIDSYLNAGIYKVDFEANNISSGIYFYRIEAGDFIKSRKMVLIK